MIAYIPNNKQNRQLVEAYFSTIIDKPGNNLLSFRLADHDGEEISCYHWQGNIEEFTLLCDSLDALEDFIDFLGFNGARFPDDRLSIGEAMIQEKGLAWYAVSAVLVVIACWLGFILGMATAITCFVSTYF